MKPTAETNHLIKRQDVRGSGTNRFPITDCNYHSIAIGAYNGRCLKAAPSFLNISRDYFKTEARHDFAEEAVCFVMMTVIATASIASGAYAVVELCRAFGAL